MRRALAPLIWVQIGVGLLGFAGLVYVGVARGRPELFAVAGIALAGWIFVNLRRPLRVWRALKRPFPETYRAILERRVVFYGLLDATERARFEKNVQRFLAEYRIQGVAGVELDDTLRVLTAAGAAMLVHGRPEWDYPAVRDVLIYPDRFDDSYQVGKQGNVLGMVHGQGPILLSAKALRRGFSKESDGMNVALHEMAHVIDMADGLADGVPDDLGTNAIAPWLEQMRPEMQRVKKHRSMLRDYAGTNSAELFAVATEAFFERPRRMRDKEPELYAALEQLYGLDPARLCEDAATRVL
ncbi:MAG: zinc-dependent peptidase [Deltaproteobacteria bacterium]|nr:zinc-dependent peptidase [Deltaproteobacteria bacterium]